MDVKDMGKLRAAMQAASFPRLAVWYALARVELGRRCQRLLEDPDALREAVADLDGTLLAGMEAGAEIVLTELEEGRQPWEEDDAAEWLHRIVDTLAAERLTRGDGP